MRPRTRLSHFSVGLTVRQHLRLVRPLAAAHTNDRSINARRCAHCMRYRQVNSTGAGSGKQESRQAFLSVKCSALHWTEYKITRVRCGVRL